MALPNNVLQTVTTYQKAELAFLLNSFCAINITNKKFKNFNEKEANLGDTVNFDLAPRYLSYNGLVITNQPSVQRVQSLVCSQAANVSASYSDQQFIFNVREYMDRFGESAMKELGSLIEADLLLNVVSGVRISDPQNSGYGDLQTSSGPYRFYGDGITPINSYGQLAQAVANFEDYGSAKNKLIGILPTTRVPAIVNTGLNQFAMDRNNEIANSWMLGKFAGCEWYQSNLLPTHTAGYVGDGGAPNNVVTVVSINAAGDEMVVTEPLSDTAANAFEAGDLLQFNDGVSGQANVRFLTFIGHKVSDQPVQVRVTARAASVAGSITISITPALVSAQTQNQNINRAITAGMTLTAAPSHKAGVIMSGDQFYMAMPQLPDLSPFTTVSQMDKDSGASIRHYFGSLFGQNVRSYVRDAIWGSTMVPENCMRLVFPM